jgi:hypothetical protein
MTRVIFKTSKRTLPQNDRMWAMLTDVASQVPWHGLKLDTEDWKLLFLDALKRELRMVPNLDGNGFVPLGRSSSDLTIEEMTDMIELIFKFGAEHGVIFHEPTCAEIFCERRKYEMLDVLRHEVSSRSPSPTRRDGGGTSLNPGNSPASAGAAHNSELDFWLTGGLAL